MVKTIFALAAFASLSALAPTAGHAEPYKWCANYGGDMGGSSNCGFTTWDQCMATVSGIGGSCDINQFYTGPEQTTPRVKHKRHSG
jgi:hypothetical protein